jgi:hypothetical protein
LFADGEDLVVAAGCERAEIGTGRTRWEAVPGGAIIQGVEDGLVVSGEGRPEDARHNAPCPVGDQGGHLAALGTVQKLPRVG